MSDSGEHSQGNPSPFFIFALLIGGTALTVALSGPYTDFGATGNVVVGLIIATAKASLVALFFMHLKYEANWKYVLLVPPLVLFLVLVVGLTPDVANKQTQATPFHLEAHADEANGDHGTSSAPPAGADGDHGESSVPPATAEAEDH